MAYLPEARMDTGKAVLAIKQCCSDSASAYKRAMCMFVPHTFRARVDSGISLQG